VLPVLLLRFGITMSLAMARASTMPRPRLGAFVQDTPRIGACLMAKVCPINLATKTIPAHGCKRRDVLTTVVLPPIVITLQTK